MDPEQQFEAGSAAFDASDYATAAALLLPLADAGHAGAQYLAAEMFRWGTGVGQDADRAVAYYTAAADAGDPRAALDLYFLLEPATVSYPPAVQSVPMDAVKAQHYLRVTVARSRDRAAGGDVEAMCLIGFLHHLGLGVDLDGAEAVWWYARAYAAGCLGAANGLCLVYHESADARAQDRAKAFYWYRTAKERGVQCVGIDVFEQALAAGSDPAEGGTG